MGVDAQVNAEHRSCAHLSKLHSFHTDCDLRAEAQKMLVSALYECAHNRTLPRIAVGSAPVEDSELLVDSLHSALNTKNVSLARTAVMSLLCTEAVGVNHL